jgi:U3 small nucleolar RNA-associated protein 18
VDGLHNPLVQTLYLGDCPIVNAAFAAGGQMAVAAGRRPFYYLVDLAAAAVERVVAPPMLAGTSSQRLKSLESFAVSPAVDNPLVAFLGDGGNIGLVSLRSRQCVGTLKMSGSARSAVFTPDGQHLITSGGDGVIYTWDLRSRRCLHKQLDEGAVGAATLCLSPDGSYLATGSTSGVVNLYRRPQGGLLEPLLGEPGALRSNGLQPAVVPPVKALMNLVTNVDTLAFNHDSQVGGVGW